MPLVMGMSSRSGRALELCPGPHLSLFQDSVDSQSFNMILYIFLELSPWSRQRQLCPWYLLIHWTEPQMSLSLPKSASISPSPPQGHVSAGFLLHPAFPILLSRTGSFLLCSGNSQQLMSLTAVVCKSFSMPFSCFLSDKYRRQCYLCTDMPCSLDILVHPLR